MFQNLMTQLKNHSRVVILEHMSSNLTKVPSHLRFFSDFFSKVKTYYVVIHPIPNHEKQVYTRPYHAEYNSISDGNTIFQIQNVVRDPYRGTSVQVDSGWFLTYHVEKVGDYDIV